MIFIFSLLFILSCGNSESTSEIESLENKPSEPVQEKFSIEQVVDDGKIYTSKDFFDAGFKEYKEYNVSKLTSATEAWYGFWGPDEDNVKYYELRFYPDHSTALSEGKAFAEDATGKDAILGRKDTMWRVGLSDRKVNVLKTSHGSYAERNETVPHTASKYAEYVIYDNVIMLCEGVKIEDSYKHCSNLINLLLNK
jgi:hypothetical protein